MVIRWPWIEHGRGGEATGSSGGGCGEVGWRGVLFYYWQDNDTFSCKWIHIHGTHSNHLPPPSPKMCLSPALRLNVQGANANKIQFTLWGILGSSNLTKFNCSVTRVSMLVFCMFLMPKLNFISLNHIPCSVTLQIQSNYFVCYGTEMVFKKIFIDN